MDGNRRWATQRGLLPYRGHKQGVETVKQVAQFCLERGISYLSLYTLSIENLLSRSEVEKEYIFKLIINGARDGLQDLIKHGVRVRFIGDRALFPSQLVTVCDSIEQESAAQTKLQLTFLFCYGSRQEILGGVKSIVRKVLDGTLAESDISDEQFRQCLWTRDIPEPELIIRTGKVVRLSNFLLYQAAYSEFYFPDCLWPELTEHHLEEALSNFSTCQRNFGV
jgi:undecaprenyl diphosphate synthase